MTSFDFVRLGAGDDEEHCNLLASYFMWFDQQNPSSVRATYVVMGKWRSRGDKAMFVLHRNATAKHSRGVSIQNAMLCDAASGVSNVSSNRLLSRNSIESDAARLGFIKAARSARKCATKW